MTDLLDEVKQDLREERTLDALKKLVPIIAIFIVTFIVVFGVKTWWTSYQNDKIFSDGGDYHTAAIKMRSGNAKDALEIFEKISTNDTAYSALANLNLAAFSALKKDFIKAITIYESIYLNKNFPKAIRDFAKIQLITVQLEAEKISLENALNELKEASLSKNEFSALADELRLNILISLNKVEEFDSLFNEIITDPNVSLSIKNRVKELVALK